MTETLSDIQVNVRVNLMGMRSDLAQAENEVKGFVNKTSSAMSAGGGAGGGSFGKMSLNIREATHGLRGLTHEFRGLEEVMRGISTGNPLAALHGLTGIDRKSTR